MVLIWYKTFVFSIQYLASRNVECLHGNWNQSRTRPPRFGDLEKKRRCPNQNCKIRRTKLSNPHPKNSKFNKINQNRNQSFSIKIQIIWKKELKLEENSTQHWFELRTPCGTKGGPYHWWKNPPSPTVLFFWGQTPPAPKKTKGLVPTIEFSFCKRRVRPLCCCCSCVVSLCTLRACLHTKHAFSTPSRLHTTSWSAGAGAGGGGTFFGALRSFHF